MTTRSACNGCDGETEQNTATVATAAPVAGGFRGDARKLFPKDSPLPGNCPQTAGAEAPWEGSGMLPEARLATEPFSVLPFQKTENSLWQERSLSESPRYFAAVRMKVS